MFVLASDLILFKINPKVLIQIPHTPKCLKSFPKAKTHHLSSFHNYTKEFILQLTQFFTSFFISHNNNNLTQPNMALNVINNIIPLLSHPQQHSKKIEHKLHIIHQQFHDFYAIKLKTQIHQLIRIRPRFSCNNNMFLPLFTYTKYSS